MEDSKKGTANDKQSLREKIERIVDRDGCSYLEAVSVYMVDNQLTPGKMAKSLCPFLMGQIQEEVRHNRLVKTEVLQIFISVNGSKPKKKK